MGRYRKNTVLKFCTIPIDELKLRIEEFGRLTVAQTLDKYKTRNLEWLRSAHEAMMLRQMDKSADAERMMQGAEQRLVNKEQDEAVRATNERVDVIEKNVAELYPKLNEIFRTQDKTNETQAEVNKQTDIRMSRIETLVKRPQAQGGTAKRARAAPTREEGKKAREDKEAKDANAKKAKEARAQKTKDAKEAKEARDAKAKETREAKIKTRRKKLEEALSKLPAEQPAEPPADQ
jgi:hypothetical protein